MQVIESSSRRVVKAAHPALPGTLPGALDDLTTRRLDDLDGRTRLVSANIIDGKAVALQIESEVASAIARLGFQPGLVAVRVGNDPASEIYVRNKAKKARELGLIGTELVFPDTMSEEELLAEIARLNADDAVDGILVQLPLP